MEAGSTARRNLAATPSPQGVPTLDSDDLVQECLAGNWEAFDVIVRKYRNRIGSIASRLLDDPRDVEDAVQDTFIEAFHCLHQYRCSGRFEWWICRIAINNVRDKTRGAWFRKTVRWTDLELDEESATDEGNRSPIMEDALRVVRRAALRKAMRQLPQRQKELLVLRYYEGYKTSEIAEILGIPEGTVRSDIVRACSRLRTILEPIYG